MTTSRTLAAALAIGALAVPAAQAQPADNAPLAPASVKAQTKEDPIADIHAPLARAAAANARAQRHRRAANVGGQYTPGTTAIHSAARRLPGPPTWPVNPQPIAPARAVSTHDSSSGANPTMLGLGIAGGLLALAGLVGITRRTRRVGRARVTA